MKKKVTKILTVILCVPIAVWLISLAKCEVLTVLHENEFFQFYQGEDMLADIKYLKILSYSDDLARIYCVTKNNLNANVFEFIQEDNVWKFNKWETTVWSSSGSASGVIWPYWWHFIYGGI